MMRFLVIVVILLVIFAVAWPWLAPWMHQLRLGHLPGDIMLKLGSVSFYFPITTCIVISLAIAFVLWLIGK
jgi:hypothetical protein